MEDERIRKVLLNDFKNNCSEYYCEGVNRDMIITWLEKQSKQKIQPKFKIGDVIKFKGNKRLKGEAETHKIVDYDNELYVFADGTTDLFCEQDLYELVDQKPAWSEEDKYNLSDIEAMIHTIKGDGLNADKLINWLKSLKDRYTWKPSDEQMEAIRLAKGYLTEKHNRDAADSLYSDLKKLKG